MFFPTQNGEWINVKDVKSIRLSSHKDTAAVVETSDDRHSVDNHTARLMRSLPVSIFPAAAGTYVLNIVKEEGAPDEVHPTMVIAWGLDAEGMSHPITANGLDDGSMSYHAIRMPDNTVVQPLAQEWPTLYRYLTHMELKLAQAPSELITAAGQAFSLG